MRIHWPWHHDGRDLGLAARSSTVLREPHPFRSLGRMGFVTFAKRLYRAYGNHAVAETAASLSYYFVFSLFPFLFFLTTIVAYIPGIRGSADMLLERIRTFVPDQAMSLIETHVRSLVATPRPHLVTLGLLATLYSASRGVDALRRALNLAYDVKESRPFWKTELLAIGMTTGGTLLVLFSVALLVAGGDIGLWVARHLHVAEVYFVVLSFVRWPVTGLAIMSAAALAYYLLPDVEQEFKFITPGSVAGTLVWFLASWGFSTYVSNFGKYNVTYGSIGGVIVLMTWFYITGFIFLMGGEMNAIIESASPDGKRSGARSAREAPPPADQRPSAVPPGAAKSATAAERSRGGISPGTRDVPA